MASKRLPHYLLNYRKRSALSQDDVAFLLGVDSGTKVCRHERFIRLPLLETALGYEVIFKKPISELFSGLFVEIEQGIKARATHLYPPNPSRGASGFCLILCCGVAIAWL